ANEELQKTLGNIDTTSATSVFERMENKVMEMEARSQAVGELSGFGIEQQFAQLEANSDVEDELAALKASMSGGALPGTAAVPQLEAAKTDTTKAPNDAVVDAELEDLRRKLNNL
ncbi:MAG: PspA/IM30 family protein, partial [Microcystaceae cyanobacterium]